MTHKKLVYVSLPLILLSLAGIAATIKYKFNTKPRYTIGLIYVPSRAFHEYLNNVLIRKIKTDDRFYIKEFNASNASDLGLLMATCNEAIQSNVDLIITTGIHCTKAAIVTTQKRQIRTPVVFMGIASAIQYGFVDSLETPGANATGVESNSPFELTFAPTDLLLFVKPTTANVLVPYGDFTPETLAPYVQKMQEQAQNSMIHITPLPIHNNNETLPKTAGLIFLHDALLYLEQDAIGLSGPGLGKLASQHGVTMFAGTIDGIKDAALSYVADPACLADMAFDLAKEILINKKNPGDLPIVQATVPRNLMINTKLCQEQDLADIDIPAVVKRIRSDPRFATVHNRIIVDGRQYI